jgi:hypothetical protein
MSTNRPGFRSAPAATKKDKIGELEKALENSQMSIRLTQMMVKQLLDQMQNSRLDIDNTMGMLNDFQYRTLALLELSGVNKKDIDKRADELKLADYDKASSAEDLAKGYLDDASGLVGEESVVTITSSTNGDEDRGIFRSKFPMSECLTPSIKDKLMGLKIGESFEEQIKGDLHKITVVSLKKVATKVQGEANGETDESN